MYNLVVIASAIELMQACYHQKQEAILLGVHAQYIDREGEQGKGKTE